MSVCLMSVRLSFPTKELPEAVRGFGFVTMAPLSVRCWF
jgi:hypothetical protein